MRPTIAWEKFLIQKRKIVISEEIKALAEEIDKDGDWLIAYLQRHGYIVRILKGIFYVKTLEERERGTSAHSIYELVAMALKKKGVKQWYFALETALKLNTMTHEYFFTDYVITDSYRTTKVISIMGVNFLFIKRGLQHFKQGIVRENKMCFSDPEKTVLDLAYRIYLRTKKKELYLPALDEYREIIDLEKTLQCLRNFPPGFQKEVSDWI